MICCTDRLAGINGYDAVTQLQTMWDVIGRSTFPRKPNASYNLTTDFSQLIASDNYDSTLRRALVDNAAGTSALMFPVSEKGFRLKPPRRLKEDDDAVKITEECAEEMSYQLMSNSNFRDALDEALLERVTFGTMGITTLYNDRHSRLDFRSNPINTYACVKDASGVLTEFYIKYELSAEHAATEWGEENLPEKVKSALGVEDRRKETFTFIVGIIEVFEWDEESRKAAKGLPVLYRVELEESKEVVVEQGFHEMPTTISAYLPITGMSFGFTPTFFLIPEVRRIYRQQELADKLGMAALAPPIAALGKYKGQIRRGPLGITYVDDMSEVPVPLHLAGQEYKIGLERIASAREDVERALHMDYFKMFSNLDDPKITATVANMMEAEKANSMGSPYHRLSVGLGGTITRAFSIMYRQGTFFPQFPDSMMKRDANGNVIENEVTGQPEVYLPEVAFENRLVQAQRGVENVKVQEWLSVMGPVLENVPQEMMNIDTEKLVRRTWRNTVGIEEALVPKQLVKQRKAEAAQMMAQQQAMQEAQQVADVQATAQ